jgi:hypothetical protein
MRAHGVPNFPDPTSGGAGVQLSGNAVNTQSPAFRSAQSVCQKLMPGGIADPGSPTRLKQGVKLAACMRAHGLRKFPDPTDVPPSTPPAPDTTILGGPDGVFTLVGSIVQTPAFKHAAAVCGLPGFGPGSHPSFSIPVTPAAG